MEYSQADELPVYKCYKEVRACKIGGIQEMETNKGGIIIPESSDIDPFKVSEEYMRKHDPQVGGYFVLYRDGYESFSPAQAFEEGYVLK